MAIVDERRVPHVLRRYGRTDGQCRGARQNAQSVPNVHHMLFPDSLANPISISLLKTCGNSRTRPFGGARSEEHTSELQSLMRISFAVFCLKKKTNMLTSHYH